VERRESLGLSPAELAEKVGISYSCYLTYENLQNMPLRKRTGAPKETAQRIADFWGESVESLWPDIVMSVRKNLIVCAVSGEDMMSLVSDHAKISALPLDEKMERQELVDGLYRVLETLTPIEQKILSMRFGIGGYDVHTLEEAGVALKPVRSISSMHSIVREINGVRVKQIEKRALTKIRWSSKSRHLRKAMEERFG